MAKRGRPGKNDPRYLARKAEELAEQQRLERALSGINPSGCPEGVNKTNTGMFQARIRLNGKRINLGSFKTPEEAGAAYRRAKDAGFTCKDSPQKYAKRGTGLRSLATQTHSCSHMTCNMIVSHWAGIKAMKKKGLLQPRAVNVPYSNTYGLPAMNKVAGFVDALPLARPLSSMPTVAAVPVRWQQPIALD